MVDREQAVRDTKFLGSVHTGEIISKGGGARVLALIAKQKRTSASRYIKLVRAGKAIGLNQWEREELYNLLGYQKFHSKLQEHTKKS